MSVRHYWTGNGLTSEQFTAPPSMSDADLLRAVADWLDEQEQRTGYLPVLHAVILSDEGEPGDPGRVNTADAFVTFVDEGITQRLLDHFAKEGT